MKEKMIGNCNMRSQGEAAGQVYLSKGLLFVG